MSPTGDRASARLLLPLAGADAAIAGQMGPKASRLATLRRAGLPVPDGFCLTAEAYRIHLAAAGLEAAAGRAASAGAGEARRLAVAIRLGLLRVPLEAAVADALAAAYARLASPPWRLLAVRSSALCEDTAATSFAGQFETILGVAGAADLVTAVRACWASLWSTRALAYMQERDVDPAGSAMAVLIQPLLDARTAGGGLSRTPDGHMLVTAAWGLGATVAHGEVVPDRYLLRRDGGIERVEPGHKALRATCSAAAGVRWHPVEPDVAARRCLTDGEATSVGRLMRQAEAVFDRPVEIEWALEGASPHLLQARPLSVESRPAAGERSLGDSGLSGHPAGAGRAAGPARVVDCEVDLARVRSGDVLVTRVPGPALAAILPRVVAVVAELGGSTSHLAALARERGIPAVLGVAGATRRIPEGSWLTVDGVLGVVRWNSRA